MPPDQTRKVIERELGGVSLEDVFEWIDLEQPLGSASISQVLPLTMRFCGTLACALPVLCQYFSGCPCLPQAASVGCQAGDKEGAGHAAHAFSSMGGLLLDSGRELHQGSMTDAICYSLRSRTVTATPRDCSAEYQAACQSSSIPSSIPPCSCLRRLSKRETYRVYIPFQIWPRS